MTLEHQKTPLDLAIEHFKTQAGLARAIGVKPMTVKQWEYRGKVPLEHAVSIEQATGGAITKEQLRPDVFAKSNLQPSIAANS